MGIEKIMHMQEELIKTYKKQISGLEKENASLRKMLDMQNESKRSVLAERAN